MLNVRNHFRLRKEIDVYVKVDAHKLADKGRIQDISLSGLRFTLDKDLKLKSGTTIMLDCPDIPALPKEGKLKWCRPIPKGVGFMCGCTFVKINSKYSDAWQQWMEANMAKLADVGDGKILGKYLGFQEE